MAERQESSYISAQGSVKIHVIRWIPEHGAIRGVVQIAHGMAEHIGRYEEFACFLAERGFLVVGNDHLGHGASVKSEAAKEYGWFYERNASRTLIEDMHSLRRQTAERYPGVPYFILGHSMGSFLLRQYLLYYGRGLSGAIIMGTGNQPLLLLAAGRMLTSVIALFRGWQHRSGLLRQMTFGSYNKKFEPSRTEADWLTRDEQIVDAYQQDRRCGFTFTLNGYHNLFSGMLVISSRKNLKMFPTDIPVFLISGEDDPVGACGKEVRSLLEVYQQLQVRDVEMKLYPGNRHEILNELDAEQVCTDIYEWLNRHMPEGRTVPETVPRR